MYRFEWSERKNDRVTKGCAVTIRHSAQNIIIDLSSATMLAEINEKIGKCTCALAQWTH